jgi:hypothetical protein
MVNPYQALTTYEHGHWKKLFDELGLLDVFGELLGTFTAPESTRKIIRYIAWTYSHNSERLVAGMDWENNKRNNFNYAGLPGDLWESIGLLKDHTVLRAIQKWLEYQDDPVFKQLQCMKDLKLEMQLSAVGRISKASNEIDYDQKYKNANYALDLEKMIKQLENQLIQNNPALKDAVRETKFSRKTTMGVETYAK